ncbi:MAG: hypothetical protein OFPI_27180 [Osedax symbiont Rs2]|nr:MAG: hypothetical protein OFPI_27180 [Osedax symbiont Rs2]
MDINADGQADLVGFSNRGLQVALSTGTRFAASQLWSSDYGYTAGWRIKPHRRMLVDVNGDGIVDLLGINRDGIHVSYGDGQSFSNAVIISSDFSNLNRDWDQHNLADVNGDGLLDVIGFHSEGVDVATMRQDKLADRGRSMIATITNGYQQRIKIRYSQMTDPSIYTKGSAAIYPARDMIRASFLVAQSRSDNGIGADFVVDYRYGAAVMQVAGRGYQGFKWIEHTDRERDIITRRQYRQQFPFTGMLDAETKHNNNLISKLSNSYLQRSLHNNHSRFAYLSQSVAQKFQLNGQPISTTTTQYLDYDNEGNLLRRNRTVKGGGKSFNQLDYYSFYSVDQQQWLLGLVSKHSQSNSSLTEETITTNHHYTYDNRGRLQSQTLQQSSPLALRTEYSRDSFGNITSVKAIGNVRDSHGNSVKQSRTSSNQYDVNGRFVIGTSNALGQQQSSVYESHYGNLINHSDINGLTTSWQYDLLGRKSKEQRANGKSTFYTDNSAVGCQYAPAHTARCRTSAPEGETPVTVYYDKLGREVRIRSVGFDGRNVFIDKTYNSAGLLAKTSRAYYQSDRRYWAEFSYDVLDRIITERQPASNAAVAITHREYSGLVTKVIDAKQQTKVTTTDVLGQVVHLQDPLAASIVYRYDAAGNLLQTIDNNANKIQLKYDQLGNKISMLDPDKGFWQYSYNAFGELVSQSDAKGQTSQLQYDTLGRMVKRQEVGLEAASTEVNSWQYDSAANGIGLLAKVNGPNNYQKTISYDALSRPITAQTQIRDGSVDRLLTVRNQYDEFSRLYRQYRPSAQGEFVLEHMYNPQGFLQSVRSHKGLVGDYSASHLTQLINQATQQAADIIHQADIIQAQVQSYFNKADYYRSLSLIVTPISANSSQILVENDQRYPIYHDSNGNQYLRKMQIIDSGAKKSHWVLAVGAHTLFIPKVKKQYSYALLKQQGDGSWQLSNVDVVSTQLTKVDSFAYVGDFNRDSQQDLIMVNGEHPSGQHLAAAASSLLQINRDIEIGAHLQLLEDAAKVLVAQGIDINSTKYQLFYNTRDRKRYIRLPHPTRSGGVRMLLGTSSITPVTMPVIQFLELTVVNGQYRLTRATDTFAHPDFASKFIATGENVYIGDNNQDGNTDLAVARPPKYRAFDDREPLGLAFFIELQKKADVIEAVAVFLQKQATDYQQLADNILVLAENSYRQANNLQLWVDNYQQFDLDADYVTFWQAKKRDAEGRLSHSVAGSGLTTTRNYDPATGQLLNIQSGFFYSQKIRDLQYQYDLLNNLPRRADLIQGVQEQFSYDALDRLNYASVSSNLMASGQYNRSFSYQYDSLGNLTYKTGAGTMGYGAGSAGPHAVTRINSRAITYDQNGNMIRNGGRTFAWNSANQPVVIKDNLNQVSFSYAPDRSRYLKTSASSRTLYLDKIYERVTSASSGEVSHKNMIYADGKLVATNVETIPPANDQLKSTTRYVHYDPLGSIDTITGPRGEVVDRLSFDPFGARRPGDWKVATAAILPSFSNRGFTGHEHIDELGLIHMNGRIYDPQLGRFLSADRHIQSPFNSQSFNRYSYVINNPLKYTDPTGWLFDANGNYFGENSPSTSNHNYRNGGNQADYGSNRYTEGERKRKQGKAKAAAEEKRLEAMEGGSGDVIRADTGMMPHISCNPINIATGEKYLSMFDYQSAGAGNLQFLRFYSSFSQEKTGLGYAWRSNFDQKLTVISAGKNSPIKVIYTKVDRQQVVFIKNTEGIWQGTDKAAEKIVEIAAGWLVSLANGNQEHYNTDGRLMSITMLGGYQQQLYYNQNGQLIQVTDSFNARLQFAYNTSGLLHSLQDPEGNITYYRYNLAEKVLTQVLYPDSTETLSDNNYKRYLYQDSRYPTAITGIKNELGQRLHTMAYDEQGRAILSELGNHAERVEVQFTSVFGIGKQSRVRTSLGRETTYQFDKNDRPIAISGHATASCVAANQAYRYDEKKNIASKTDWKGVATNYQYNDRNLEIQRVEALATAVERTVLTTWHPSLPLPTKIEEPGKTTEFNYTNNGLLIKTVGTDTLSKTSTWQKFTATQPSRTTHYQYNQQGLLTAVDGPQAGNQDITRFSYDANGNRIAVENALGHRSITSAFDSSGRPLKVVDANGIETQLSYNPRGWLISKKVITEVGESITQYKYAHSGNYQGQGQVSQVTLANGNIINYRYDTANRLVGISNSQGAIISYTLDFEGNRIAETVHSDSAELLSSQTRVFDELSRLLSSIGADQQTTSYQYDRNGNLTGVTDPLNNKTQFAFDALNRLITSTDANGGVLHKTYNPQHQLTSITDQRGLTTRYKYNGFGERIVLISPDTGTTNYSYNSSGLLTSQVDARGIETQYSYDLLGRVTQINYPEDMANNISYQYDSYSKEQSQNIGAKDVGVANFAIGRLIQVQDPSGSSQYQYNALGQISQTNYRIADVNYETNNHYNQLGELTAITYPSGRKVALERNKYGQISSLSSQRYTGAVNQTVVSNLIYAANGSLQSMDYGNGASLQINRDLDSRIRQVKVANAANDQNFYLRDYQYDNANNITAITDQLNTEKSQQFAYDNMYRLVDAKGSYGHLQYLYDAVGNRLSRSFSAVDKESASDSLAALIETYDYAHDSNRLVTVAKHSANNSVSERILSYDPVGNITNDNRNTDHSLGLIYGANNRLRQVANNKQQSRLSTYHYNAKGQRVSKLVTNADGSKFTVHFHYNQFDQMIAETDYLGSVLKEYLYVDGQRVASIDYASEKKGILAFIHNDHLGTPQLMTDNTTRVVWQSNTLPFGEEVQVVVNSRMNLKFPGQYQDSETGYSQNYFRDYDASLGRYIQSDPIGLLGGVNTFAYVGENPVGAVDFYGLEVIYTGKGRIWSAGAIVYVGGQLVLDIEEPVSEFGTHTSFRVTSDLVGLGVGIGIPGGATYFDFTITDPDRDTPNLHSFHKKSVVIRGLTFSIGNGISQGPLSIGNLSVDIPNAQVTGFDISGVILNGMSKVSDIKVWRTKVSGIKMKSSIKSDDCP